MQDKTSGKKLNLKAHQSKLKIQTCFLGHLEGGS